MAIMLHEIHDQTLQRIGAGESGYAIANVQKDGIAQDLSFHKGTRLVGTYHGGPRSLMNGELKEAMILSIAQGRPLAANQRPGMASPATFYKMDIVRMIRERRMRGDDSEADVLERYRTEHPEVFVA